MEYSFLCDQYPEAITMDQLYRICHISKRKARWLLENGIILCKDSGKKTRRFKIKLDDVIEFLELRDAGVPADMMLVGIFSSEGYGSIHPGSPAHGSTTGLYRRSFWIAGWMAPDMLTVPQTVLLCGYD